MIRGAEKRALVIGGGVTGMRASLDLASLGIEVDLVEREMSLGGLLDRVNTVFPSMKPSREIVGQMVQEVEGCESIQVHLGSEVRSIERRDGRFIATVTTNDEEGEIEAECVIIATGLRPMDPTIIPEFGYGRYEEVVTSMEFETLLRSNTERGIVGRSGSPVRRVVFIQCVGSRVERRGLRYCSAVCCMGAIKNALILKGKDPEIDVTILYIDIRTHGKGWEDAYRLARKSGVRFIRGQPSMVAKRPGGEDLLVFGENTLLKELYEIEADLVVLQVGLETTSETREMISMLGVGIRNDGLPSDDQVEGVFIAGSLDSPKDMASCLAQAGASAASAANYLKRKQ